MLGARLAHRRPSRRQEASARACPGQAHPHRRSQSAALSAGLREPWSAPQDPRRWIESLPPAYACPLQDHRQVDDSGGQCPSQRVAGLGWKAHERQPGKRLQSNGFPNAHQVQWGRVETSPRRTDGLVTNDPAAEATEATQAVRGCRWKIAPLHRAGNQLTGLERCQCRTARIPRTHSCPLKRRPSRRVDAMVCEPRAGASSRVAERRPLGDDARWERDQRGSGGRRAGPRAAWPRPPGGRRRGRWPATIPPAATPDVLGEAALPCVAHRPAADESGEGACGGGGRQERLQGTGPRGIPRGQAGSGRVPAAAAVPPPAPGERSATGHGPRRGGRCVSKPPDPGGVWTPTSRRAQGRAGGPRAPGRAHRAPGARVDRRLPGVWEAEAPAHPRGVTRPEARQTRRAAVGPPAVAPPGRRARVRPAVKRAGGTAGVASRRPAAPAAACRPRERRVLPRPGTRLAPGRATPDGRGRTARRPTARPGPPPPPGRPAGRRPDRPRLAVPPSGPALGPPSPGPGGVVAR